MLQSVIRVLWPQAPQKQVDAWLCCVESVGLPTGSQQPVVTAQPVTLHWAIAACAEADKEQEIPFNIVLPAEMVLFDCVTMPAKSRRQALQALPFMVEEQLADDIEDVHLAIGQPQSGTWPVVAFTRRDMQVLFALLQSVAATPNQLTVDAEMLMLEPGQLRIVLHGDRVLVRSARLATGMALDSAALLMPMLEDGERFTQVLLHIDEANEQHRLLAGQWEAEFSALSDVRVTVSPAPIPLSVLLFPATGSSGALNLLQGEFLLRRQSGQNVLWWQWGIAVVVLLVILQGALQLVSGWYFSRQASHFVMTAEKQYQTWFPDAKKINNPRKRLASRLNSDAQASGQGGFSHLFGLTVKALQEVQGSSGKIAVEQLRYEGRRAELELELTLQSIQQLDQLKKSLEKAGLRAEIASANEGEGGSVTGHIKIGGGA